MTPELPDILSGDEPMLVNQDRILTFVGTAFVNKRFITLYDFKFNFIG